MSTYSSLPVTEDSPTRAGRASASRQVSNSTPRSKASTIGGRSSTGRGHEESSSEESQLYNHPGAGAARSRANRSSDRQSDEEKSSGTETESDSDDEDGAAPLLAAPLSRTRGCVSCRVASILSVVSILVAVGIVAIVLWRKHAEQQQNVQLSSNDTTSPAQIPINAVLMSTDDSGKLIPYVPSSTSLSTVSSSVSILMSRSVTRSSTTMSTSASGGREAAAPSSFHPSSTKSFDATHTNYSSSSSSRDPSVDSPRPNTPQPSPTSSASETPIASPSSTTRPPSSNTPNSTSSAPPPPLPPSYTPPPPSPTPPPPSPTPPPQPPKATPISPAPKPSPPPPPPPPPAPPSPPANKQTGWATFFYQGGAAGACGVVHPDSYKLLAFSLSSRFKSSDCNRQVQVTNKDNGKSVVVTVQDACEACGANDIDLSTGAFDAIGSEDAGKLNDIEWYFL